MTRLLVVTPARNEVDRLPRLVEAVLAQTRRPDRWVIVDDSSTDGTTELVEQLGARHAWVSGLHRTGGTRREDASKARAVNEAIRAHLSDETEMIVSFDADMIPPVDYLARVEQAFDGDRELGVYGGVPTYRRLSGEHPEPFPHDMVSGGMIAVRRATYEQIGGFMALPYGGIDSSACLAAQMHGWRVRSDSTLVGEHTRPMGEGEGQAARKDRFRRGREDWDIGVPWWFELGKSIRWLVRRPYIVGGIYMFAGFLRSALTRTPRTPPPELIDFTRRRARARIARRVRTVRHR